MSYNLILILVSCEKNTWRYYLFPTVIINQIAVWSAKVCAKFIGKHNIETSLQLL